MSYQIISDGSCDLGTETAAAQQIQIVPFYVAFEEEQYLKEIEEMPVRDFYQKMVEDSRRFPKSSLPSVQDFLDAFTLCLEQGKDVICICITTKFSGSYNSAMNAAQMLANKYPDRKIAVIDAMVNTVLQGLLVLEAVRMRDNGLEFAETVRQIERIRESGRIIFTIGNMDYLVHGGRVGKVKGAAASTLRIRPIIVLKEGEIFSSGISRNRKNSLRKVVEQVRNHLEKEGAPLSDYRLVVGYGYDREEAEAFREQLAQVLRGLGDPGELGLCQIGATIGVHTGPHPLGVGILKKYDV